MAGIRFQGAAASKKVVTKCPTADRCDTTFPVWLRGDHPTVVEGKVRREVCIQRMGNCCRGSRFIEVKNCGSYYIYKLHYPGVCNARYYSTD